MSRLERENLYRASFPAVVFRGETGTDSPPTLTGHFAVFSQPTEISSLREGNFIEQIAPGAFTKTFAENRGQIKVLFQHGRDPQIGDRPIAETVELREDDQGAYYEAELFDGIDPLLMSGLRAGAYGASFRFQVMREDVNKTPGESAANPRGIPERTIREASVAEYGPVTWGAYSGATSGVRSITDTIYDVDALAYAGAIILDEERMNQSRIFVSRGIDPTKATLISTKYAVPTEPAPQRETADRLRAIISDARAMTDAEPAVMLDGDTVEALGSLIEVCESSLEAMESLLGIDDDTTPDADDAMGSEMNSTEPVGTVRSDSLESVEQDAPPSDSAEPSVAHPIRGRRDTHKSYLRKESPSWQL